MTKLITLHVRKYNEPLIDAKIKEVVVNVDHIEVIDSYDDGANILLSSGGHLLVTETMEEVKKKMYEVPEEVMDLTCDSIKNIQKYLNERFK